MQLADCGNDDDLVIATKSGFIVGESSQMHGGVDNGNSSVDGDVKVEKLDMQIIDDKEVVKEVVHDEVVVLAFLHIELSDDLGPKKESILNSMRRQLELMKKSEEPLEEGRKRGKELESQLSSLTLEWENFKSNVCVEDDDNFEQPRVCEDPIVEHRSEGKRVESDDDFDDILSLDISSFVDCDESQVEPIRDPLVYDDLYEAHLSPIEKKGDVATQKYFEEKEPVAVSMQEEEEEQGMEEEKEGEQKSEEEEEEEVEQDDNDDEEGGEADGYGFEEEVNDDDEQDDGGHKSSSSDSGNYFSSDVEIYDSESSIDSDAYHRSPSNFDRIC
ncbi:glutamic acid-rich protein-like [Chenopodium quinoa]|uniref:glutamic acid-rich protein-like n=1 Tax=Chenopodium quinoa TaxID=63459 RepID=UPI000B78E6A4|nr:glutamic acid-rich protein-like [Chenopodium quinoa]